MFRDVFFSYFPRTFRHIFRVRLCEREPISSVFHCRHNKITFTQLADWHNNKYCSKLWEVYNILAYNGISLSFGWFLSFFKTGNHTKNDNIVHIVNFFHLEYEFYPVVCIFLNVHPHFPSVFLDIRMSSALCHTLALFVLFCVHTDQYTRLVPLAAVRLRTVDLQFQRFCLIVYSLVPVPCSISDYSSLLKMNPL